MSFSGKKSDGGGDFKNATPGMVNAVCTRIVDLGTQEGGQFGPKRKVMIGFEIDERMDDGKRFMAQSRFTLSFHERAILLQTLESWRGRAYTKDDLIELAPALGRPAFLNLMESEDGKYVNIKSVSPLPRGMQPMKPEGKTILFSLDDPDWDAYNDLSEYYQELIAKSPEYKDLMGQPAPATRPQTAAPAQRPRTEPAEPMADDFDDDIPF